MLWKFQMNEDMKANMSYQLHPTDKKRIYVLFIPKKVEQKLSNMENINCNEKDIDMKYQAEAQK